MSDCSECGCVHRRELEEAKTQLAEFNKILSAKYAREVEGNAKLEAERAVLVAALKAIDASVAGSTHQAGIARKALAKVGAP